MPWIEKSRLRIADECHKKGHNVRVLTTGRSIHILGLLGGHGEVRQVQHPYCLTCGQEQPEITYGLPMQEDVLVSYVEDR